MLYIKMYIHGECIYRDIQNTLYPYMNTHTRIYTNVVTHTLFIIFKQPYTCACTYIIIYGHVMYTIGMYTEGYT